MQTLRIFPERFYIILVGILVADLVGRATNILHLFTYISNQDDYPVRNGERWFIFSHMNLPENNLCAYHIIEWINNQVYR